MGICIRCKQREQERFDPIGPDDEGYISPYCSSCADHEYAKHQERREWDHYHNEH